MKRKLFVIASVLLCLAQSNLHSQTRENKSQNTGISCSCLTDFDRMVEVVTASYAGYEDKITGRNKANFEKFTNRLRVRAAKAGGPECEAVLSEWVEFFRDGHLRVRTHEYFDSFAKNFAENPRKPSLQILGAEFIVLRIPTFHESKTDLDKILADHRDKISSTPNLIIDLRGNDGGSDWTYTNLMPLLYTNPIITVAGGIRASDASIKYFERFVNKDKPEETPPWVTDLLKKLREHKGTTIPADEPERIVLDKVQLFPKNIAVLIDGSNMSAAETFLLKARQSKKVKLFGSNTKGVVDYLNPTFEALPCKRFVLATPLTKRSMKLPQDAIDNVGILPDIRISDKVDDKIQFIVNHYRNLNR